MKKDIGLKLPVSKTNLDAELLRGNDERYFERWCAKHIPERYAKFDKPKRYKPVRWKLISEITGEL